MKLPFMPVNSAKVPVIGAQGSFSIPHSIEQYCFILSVSKTSSSQKADTSRALSLIKVRFDSPDSCTMERDLTSQRVYVKCIMEALSANACNMSCTEFLPNLQCPLDGARA